MVEEETPTPVEPTETPVEEETATPEPSTPEEPTEPTETPEEETPSDEPADEETPEETGDDFDYTEYNDPARRQIVEVLREANIPVEEAHELFAAALESQDITKIDQAAIREKLGDKADLVLLLANTYYEGAFKEMKALENTAFETAGGEETFNAMRDWANAKEKTDPAFAKDLAEIRGLIATETARGVKAGVQALTELYAADPDTTIPADLTVGDKASSGDASNPLSRADYTALVEKAIKEGNYDSVVAGLKKRRQAGMKQGL